jgi:hypothetical protein
MIVATDQPAQLNRRMNLNGDLASVFGEIMTIYFHQTVLGALNPFHEPVTEYHNRSMRLIVNHNRNLERRIAGFASRWRVAAAPRDTF